MAPSGRVALLGLSEGELKLPVILLIKKGVDFHGSRLNCNQFPGVISLLESGRIDPRPLISREYPFEQVEEAMRSFDESPEEVTKVLLKF